MLGPTLYRMINMAKRKPLAVIIALAGIVAAAVSVMSCDNPPFIIYPREQDTIRGFISLLLLVCFDYSFAVGFRSGVLGFSLSDVSFHMAGPFTKRFNLMLSFIYGLSSIAVFLWILCINAPFFGIWIGMTSGDLGVFLFHALLIMTVTFLFTSFISARWPSSIKARVIPVVSLLAVHFIAVVLEIRELIGCYGSFEAVKAQRSNVIIGAIGNSWVMRYFPGVGPFCSSCSSLMSGSWIFTAVTVLVIILILIAEYVIYKKTEFDYYEEAYSNAQKIADIIEASKAGVEAVNTGIARTARVGNEKLERGWGASAFFHMHLFENKRTSRFFFVNKVALVYRVFALLILFMIDGLISEDLDAVVILTGVVTMLVLNAIVFGGGKTVLEFNRPYLFLVPEKSTKKLAMCLVADVPEMLFDAIICCIMIKIVAFREFTVFPMTAFILLMVAFDLLSSMTGLICVRLLGGLGKFSVMFVRYIAILGLIVIGMIPSNLMAGLLVTVVARSMPTALGIIILSMAAVYSLIWFIMLLLSHNIVDKADAS